MKPKPSVRTIHDAFDRGEFSAVELTRQYLAAARKSQHNAYISLCEERALGQARAADERIAQNQGKVPRESHPLLGIPLGIKDIFTIEGVRTTCASKMLGNYIPPYTATLVQRLEAVGAVTLGKTNMDEFAMGGSNENSAFGKVLHPTHPDRVPGGSSGGSAAAVGAELCVASIGTDTGGSIRLPAHYCGLVGLKPTYGSISRYGMIAFASSLDQAGPMANTVEDAALLLDAMSGHDPRDSTSNARAPLKTAQTLASAPDWKKIRIGVPAEYFTQGISSEVETSVRAALSWYESQGAKLVPISLPHTQYSVAIYYIVAVSEASSNLARFDGVRFGVRSEKARGATELADFYRKSRDLFGAEVKRRIILGTFTLSSGYSEAYFRRACQVRRLVQRDFLEAFQSVDVIAGPVSPTAAYRFGEKSDPLQMYLNDILTIPANLAGLPALSLPCGKNGQGLPIGLHLIGPAQSEPFMMSFAHAFEIREGA
jgi:aspartyl-tRNA(Asn)/glutamyl-tRNA(Gln) amidotransferase subunit A